MRRGDAPGSVLAESTVPTAAPGPDHAGDRSVVAVVPWVSWPPTLTHGTDLAGARTSWRHPFRRPDRSVSFQTACVLRRLKRRAGHRRVSNALFPRPLHHQHDLCVDTRRPLAFGQPPEE